MISSKGEIVTEKQEGFTLVEVVIASTVMMLVFVALLSAITFARRMQSVCENKLACLHIARQHIEPFSSYMYDDEATFKAGSYIIQDNPETEEGARGTYVISEVASESSKDVKVTINWIEPSGKPYSIELYSSYSRSLHR